MTVTDDVPQSAEARLAALARSDWMIVVFHGAGRTASTVGQDVTRRLEGAGMRAARFGDGLDAADPKGLADQEVRAVLQVGSGAGVGRKLADSLEVPFLEIALGGVEQVVQRVEAVLSAPCARCPG